MHFKLLALHIINTTQKDKVSPFFLSRLFYLAIAFATFIALDHEYFAWFYFYFKIIALKKI